MISDGGSFGQLSVHVGTDWSVWCMTYPDNPPILLISADSTTVSFALAGDQAGAAFAAFARKLAGATERFAAEAERLHSGRQAAGQVGIGSKSAQGKAAGTAA